MDVLSTARAGLVAAGGRFAASAQRTAAAGLAADADPVREVVEQAEAKTAFKANVEVVKIADEMWRALLEIQVRSDHR